jgi:predicted nucleic acid-binding protein
VVLDTSVITTGFRSRNGASFALLDRVAAGVLVPLLTTPLFLQYEDVLKRPEQLRASGLTPALVDDGLTAFAQWAEPVMVHYLWRPQLPDPGDELVFEAAINGRADALVTYDFRHFAAAAARFRLRLARPAELLKELGS